MKMQGKKWKIGKVEWWNALRTRFPIKSGSNLPIFHLSIFLLFLSLTCSAQKDYNIWCFGQNAGVDFNSGSPVSFGGTVISTQEGCSSIADANGILLFYTDGVNVWNRNHIAMPNGFGLFGGQSSTQSALIVQQPGSASIYYVFTTDEALGPNGFCYSIVDMTINGGLGDVTTKNVQLFTPSPEKVCATRHSNGTDVWVMGHEIATNNFRCYLLTSTGLSVAPVISSVGSIHPATSSDVIGYMKFSPNGQHLALAIRYQYIFELFDFNSTTGTVSNSITIPSTGVSYGVEFSPDNTKLYLADSQLNQYDITSGVAATIIASKTFISNDYWALQLGPDDKIYCASYLTSFLNVINSPNNAGVACNYAANAVALAPGVCRLGLPNHLAGPFNVSVLPPLAQFSASDSVFCSESGKCINFFDHSTGNPTSWQWLFPGATPSSSTNQNPDSICYYVQGTYAVTLIVSNNNGTDTLDISPRIIFSSPPNPPTITILGGDTLISSQGSAYQWYFNGSPIGGATDSFYVGTQSGTYAVSINDSLGCTAISGGVFIAGVSSYYAASGINLYPNPVTDQLTISFPSLFWNGTGGEPVDLIITDMVGKALVRETVDKFNSNNAANKNTATNYSIPLDGFSDGLYMLSIRATSEQPNQQAATVNKKFIVSHR